MIPLLWILPALLLFVGQMAFVLVREYRRPQKAVAWLVLVYALPLIGFVVYVFVAREYSRFPPANRDENRMLNPLQERLARRCRRRTTTVPAGRPLVGQDALRAMLQHPNFLPVTAGNETTVYADGKEAFAAMFDAMASARHHLHLEFYIIRDDRIGRQFQKLLIRKAKEGVQVRLLYDGIGCHRLRPAYLRELKDAGVDIGCFSPPLPSFLKKQINYRNHRKILVADGEVGFFGGLNVGDEYLGEKAKFGYWRDTHFRIKGDAVLWMQFTFAQDWFRVKRQLLDDPLYYPLQPAQGNDHVQIIKSGPDETILELLFTLIVSAKKRIYIETPYFVPDPAILLALKTAAMRGVDVRILIPAHPDTKLVYWAALSFVRELLPAGIRFYRYLKGFIHAKVILCDDIACSGSANMDMRSFTGQFEINAMFFDGRIVKRLLADFFRDLNDSEEIRPAAFRKRPVSQRPKEVVARLLSPLF